MFSARIVGLIADYVGGGDGKGTVWPDVVVFLKRERGETKDGSVSFPDALIQLLGENAVGHEQAVKVRDSEPPLGLRYRQVIRAQPEYPNDLFFLVPRGVRAAEDGTDWGVKWGRLTIADIDGIKPINSDSEQFKYPTETCVELLSEDHEMWDQIDEGDRYDDDSDYVEANPDETVPQVECQGCEEPCLVQLTCDCGGDFCENCKCGNCEVICAFFVLF
jgi:hypothetical protein